MVIAEGIPLIKAAALDGMPTHRLATSGRWSPDALGARTCRLAFEGVQKEITRPDNGALDGTHSPGLHQAFRREITWSGCQSRPSLPALDGTLTRWATSSAPPLVVAW